ncbi:hypothetical protein AOQ84DRAFT_386967 [Glonium stellatum]|uniref:Uncharacterized protein n=1 Tax=Glonium stellatum TaxID=574774 RepID=A0A8E2F639_9PEZI|nr:hypothetical protein AOQ84DRAFT_386967 [Glonium stellatum]
MPSSDPKSNTSGRANASASGGGNPPTKDDVARLQRYQEKSGKDQSYRDFVSRLQSIADKSPSVGRNAQNTG